MLHMNGVKKIYRTDMIETHALADFSLDIEDGEFVAVMGPSGSGKSTLLHILGALDTPDEGSVSLNGNRLSSLTRAQLAAVRRRDVGFVFQFFNLVPVLTVEENIRLPATLDGTETDERIGALIAKLGLDARRHSLPAQLSGGEQQRAAIARALVNEPNVIFADEPTGNLDRRSGTDVMTLLRSLNDDGQTVVLVTHDPTVAAYASRVAFMQDGKLVAEEKLTGSRRDTNKILTRLTEIEV